MMKTLLTTMLLAGLFLMPSQATAESRILDTFRHLDSDATTGPTIHQSQGEYEYRYLEPGSQSTRRSRLSANEFSFDSLSNEYTFRDHPHGLDSITNEFGEGSPYKFDGWANEFSFDGGLDILLDE